jgi:hypothetical protein
VRKYLSYVKYAPHVALVVMCLMYWFIWRHTQEPEHFDTPPPASPVEGLPTEPKECPPPGVVTIVKTAAVKADLVPEYAKKDPDKQVTAAIEIPPHKTETLVTSVFDMSTGINTLSYRQEPEPFFGWMHDKAVGIKYDIKDRIEVQGRWTPLRIGNLLVEAEARMNEDSEFYLGGGVMYGWN